MSSTFLSQRMSLRWPASDTVREEYQRAGKSYTTLCEHCGHLYSWATDLNLREALCEKCGKTYDCEFGIIAS